MISSPVEYQSFNLTVEYKLWLRLCGMVLDEYIYLGLLLIFYINLLDNCYGSSEDTGKDFKLFCHN